MRTLLAVLLVALVSSARGHDCPPQAGGHDIIIQTNDGYIGGAKTALGFEFKAVPFAKPPLGELRWAPPEPLDAWKGVLNSTRIPLACPQTRTDNGPTGEDCLYLSIYVPLSFEDKPKAKRDVAIFWHGGAFRGGGNINFIGDYLANATETVVVVGQYRLGALGLLGNEIFEDESGTYGNYAIMDQQATMMWVRENIRAFGGNPKSVTITGQSAGSISVAIHAVAPASRGLYQRAIGHSGVGYSGNLLEPKSWINNTMWKVVDGVGCSTQNCNKNKRLTSSCIQSIRHCLRSAPLSSILAVQAALSEFTKPRPAVDGVIIPDQPIKLVRAGRFNRVPTILGTMNNESTVLQLRNYPANSNKTQFDAYVNSTFGPSAIAPLTSLYPVGTPGGYKNHFSALAKIDTDWYYACPIIEWLEAMHSKGQRQAYLYVWTYEANWFPSYYGAWHNEDIVYLTQQGCVLNAPAPAPCQLFTDATAPGEMPLVRKLQGFWSSHLARGRPGVSGWEPYTQANGWPRFVIRSPTQYQVVRGSNSPLQASQCAYLNSISGVNSI